MQSALKIEMSGNFKMENSNLIPSELLLCCPRNIIPNLKIQQNWTVRVHLGLQSGRTYYNAENHLVYLWLCVF